MLTAVSPMNLNEMRVGDPDGTIKNNSIDIHLAKIYNLQTFPYVCIFERNLKISAFIPVSKVLN